MRCDGYEAPQIASDPTDYLLCMCQCCQQELLRTRLVLEPMKPPSARHTRRLLRDTCAPKRQLLSYRDRRAMVEGVSLTSGSAGIRAELRVAQPLC